MVAPASPFHGRPPHSQDIIFLSAPFECTTNLIQMEHCRIRLITIQIFIAGFEQVRTNAISGVSINSPLCGKLLVSFEVSQDIYKRI